MALDETVVAAVANENFKTVAGFAATQMNILLSEAVASAGRRANLADASMGQTLKVLNEIDPSEAVSVAKELEADLGKRMADLGAAVAGIQQLMKGAGNTPPVTP